jgi:hypothetical protein
VKKIIDYAIAFETSPGALSNAVQKLIGNGWQPFGSVVIEPGEGIQALWSQPLVKYEAAK